MRRLSNQSGFTFIEMCIVVAIIGVLMVIAVPNYQKAVANAQNKSCEANRKLIESQVESYYMDLNSYPPTDTATEKKTINQLIASKYLKEEPKCPSKGEYTVTIDEKAQTIQVTCSVHPTPSS